MGIWDVDAVLSGMHTVQCITCMSDRTEIHTIIFHAFEISLSKPVYYNPFFKTDFFKLIESLIRSIVSKYINIFIKGFGEN